MKKIRRRGGYTPSPVFLYKFIATRIRYHLARVLPVLENTGVTSLTSRLSLRVVVILPQPVRWGSRRAKTQGDACVRTHPAEPLLCTGLLAGHPNSRRAFPSSPESPPFLHGGVAGFPFGEVYLELESPLQAPDEVWLSLDAAITYLMF